MSGMDNYRLITLAVVALLSLTAGIASAATSTTITYQGMLKDSSGNPITTTGDIVFSLYDVASGGTPLDTDTHVVAVTDGLFTTALDFDPQYYDGRGLWLAVSIQGEVLTPRQEFRPVPYALGLVPGATVVGTMAPSVVTFANYWGPAVTAVSMGDYSKSVYVGAVGDESIGVYSSTTGANSPAIYGVSAQDVGVYGEGDEGGGVMGSSVKSPGVWGSSQIESGVFGQSSFAAGVYGYSQDGVGVRGYSNFNNGVWGRSNFGYGVFGNSTDKVGVYGEGKEGGYFTTISAGTIGNKLAGVHVSTAFNYNPGVSIETDGDNSQGVFAMANGVDSPGIYAISDQARGIEGYTRSTNQWIPAIFGQNDGAGDGLYGVSNNRYGTVGVSETSHALYGDTKRADHMYGVYTPDYMYAAKYDGGGADVAEYCTVRGEPEAGTVLVIGGDGILEPATSAYDTAVAGIVSTAPGVSLGTKEDGNDGEALVALAGRVPCRVDASYGAIRPGDLLTTSATPGHAMKAEPVELQGREFYPDGTILGKALGSLETGTGVIDVIVTLQ